MCGIVGYLGPENPKNVILQGLKALEYRGYDSAGVSILHQGQFQRVRAEGKLSELEEKLQGQEYDGHLGIGHTRWATHGPPSERNAHPHTVGGVSIVHNGIIENYADLRDELREQGSQFDSDTDSELIAHLLAHKVEAGQSLLDAVLQVAQKLRGAFSVLAVSQSSPNEMVAFKNGPPLILGLTEDAVVVASDIQAIVPYTKKVVYLEDNEVAWVEGTQVQLFDSAGQKQELKIVEVDWSADQAEKQGYAHYMLKEIFEQPRAIASAMEPHVRLEDHSVHLRGVGFSINDLEQINELDVEKDERLTQEILSQAERIFIVACGTSYYAGMVAEYVFEALAGVPVEIDIASEFRYRNPVIPKNSLVVFISQSGETADTLAAVRLAKELGAYTLSLCNVKRSTIDRECDGHLYMNAGVEIGVASTKAFMCSVTMMSLLAIATAKAKGKMSKERESEYINALLGAPSQVEKVLNCDKFFAEAANTLKEHRGFLYLGRGVSYPIAMEGALKLKELAYMHAEGYAAGEMKHGPLALIDQSMAVVTLVPKDTLYEKSMSNLEEAKARGGKIISLGSGEDEKLRELSDHYLPLPPAKWLVNPLLEVVPLQLLAYHVADALGNDVDQPRNLAKSVTVE